jgi:hypothetical protein
VLLGEEAGAMALDLVHKLTQHSVSARYTAAQALSHPFVADALNGGFCTSQDLITTTVQASQ